MKRDEAAGGETVEALEARRPFRFPREMVIGLLALAGLWEIISMLVPPFVVPGWGRIFKSLAGLRLDFVLVTLARVAAALLISFVIGLGLAVAIVVVCAPVFLVDVLDGMKGVSKDLRDMIMSFRPTRTHVFTKLVLPATLPAILTSWKINLSLAIRVVTIAELVGAVTGIGYGLVVAQELFSVADVFAWTLILVVILFLAEALLTRVEERLLRWRT